MAHQRVRLNGYPLNLTLESQSKLGSHKLTSVTHWLVRCEESLSRNDSIMIPDSDCLTAFPYSYPSLESWEVNLMWCLIIIHHCKTCCSVCEHHRMLLPELFYCPILQSRDDWMQVEVFPALFLWMGGHTWPSMLTFSTKLSPFLQLPSLGILTHVLLDPRYMTRHSLQVNQVTDFADMSRSLQVPLVSDVVLNNCEINNPSPITLSSEVG